MSVSVTFVFSSDPATGGLEVRCQAVADSVWDCGVVAVPSFWYWSLGSVLLMGLLFLGGGGSKRSCLMESPNKNIPT